MVLLLGEHTLFSCSARSTSRNTLGHCVIENPWCRPQFPPRHIHRPWLPPFLSGILSLFPSPLKRCCCWCCCSSSYTYFGPNSFHCKGLLSTHPLISLIYLNSSSSPCVGWLTAILGIPWIYEITIQRIIRTGQLIKIDHDQMGNRPPPLSLSPTYSIQGPSAWICD